MTHKGFLWTPDFQSYEYTSGTKEAAVVCLGFNTLNISSFELVQITIFWEQGESDMDPLSPLLSFAWTIVQSD